MTHTQSSRAALLVVLLVGLLGGLLAAAPTAAAATKVRIKAAYYDSPGADTGSNNSLNAEYIVIKNYGSRGKVLTDWTLRDPDGHVYTFPTFKLRAGRAVKVHTGSGSDTGRHLYSGEGWYVWNNTGDVAKLKKPGGTTVDRCQWDGGSRYETC